MKKVIGTILISTFALTAVTSANMGLAADVKANTFFGFFKKDKENREKNLTTTSSTTTLTTTQKACLATAVEKRENAVITSLDNLYSSIRNALVARKTAVVAAINANTNDSSVSAYATYKSSLKTSLDKFKSDRKLANTNFKSETNNCGIDTGKSGIHIKSDAFFEIF